MGIILEGPDASGKSTLGRAMASRTGSDLHLSGGAPKTDQQMWEMIQEQEYAASTGMIVDRVSCISQQVYRDGLFLRSDLMAESRRLLASRVNLLVYARPPDHVLMNPNFHEWKDYDTEEWKVKILANQADYVKRYDLLMAELPCLVFDWTDESSHHIQELLCDFRNPDVFARLLEMAHRGK